MRAYEFLTENTSDEYLLYSFSHQIVNSLWADDEIMRALSKPPPMGMTPIGKIKDFVKYNGSDPRITALLNKRIFHGPIGPDAGAAADERGIILPRASACDTTTLHHELRHVLDYIDDHIKHNWKKRNDTDTWSSNLELSAIFSQVLNGIAFYIDQRKRENPTGSLTDDRALNIVKRCFKDKERLQQYLKYSKNPQDIKLYKNYLRKAGAFFIFYRDNWNDIQSGNIKPSDYEKPRPAPKPPILQVGSRVRLDMRQWDWEGQFDPYTFSDLAQSSVASERIAAAFIKNDNKPVIITKKTADYITIKLPSGEEADFDPSWIIKA